jgi:hypothetical protein
MLVEFGPSLFAADWPTVPFFCFPYPTRMAVARLNHGSAWVCSAREKVLVWKPERLLIAHGACAQTGATQILEDALAWI